VGRLDIPQVSPFEKDDFLAGFGFVDDVLVQRHNDLFIFHLSLFSVCNMIIKFLHSSDATSHGHSAGLQARLDQERVALIALAEIEELSNLEVDIMRCVRFHFD
jgi:hypothetical protein